MRYRFHTADVFTDRPFGGNPLSVFPRAEGLGPVEMQQVARELSFAETVFVLPPADPAHTRRLRIFTPRTEVPFAGHSTIGAAHVLAATGEVALAGEETRLVLEEGVGPVPVCVRAHDGQPVFAQLSAARLPEFGPEAPETSLLADMLSLEIDDVARGEEGPRAVSCGLPVLLVPVRSREALRRAELRRGVWQDVLASFWAPHVYVYNHDPEQTWPAIRARAFSPGVGIGEDPATGAAATALAGHLADRDGLADGKLRWQIGQGLEMGRPSVLEIEADRRHGQTVGLRVGGASVLVIEGTMEIPA